MVIAFLGVAVVLQVEVGLRDALLCPGQLRRGQSEPGDMQPLGDRHFGESPPAAADFKDALAGPSLQPVKDALILGLLGRLQRAIVTGTIATELPLASQHLLMPYRIRMGV